MDAIVINNTDQTLVTGLLSTNDRMYAMEQIEPGEASSMLLKGATVRAGDGTVVPGSQRVLLFAGHLDPNRDVASVRTSHTSNHTDLTSSSGKADGLPVYANAWIPPGMHVVSNAFMNDLPAMLGPADNAAAQTDPATGLRAATYPPFAALATAADFMALATIQMSTSGLRAIDASTKSYVTGANGSQHGGLTLRVQVVDNTILVTVTRNVDRSKRQRTVDSVPIAAYIVMILVAIVAATLPWILFYVRRVKLRGRAARSLGNEELSGLRR